MYRSVYALAADTILHDADSNNLSAINICEQINSARYPVALNRITALFLIERQPADPETPSILLQVFLDEDMVMQHEGPIRFAGKERTRVMVTFSGLVVPKPGKLVFVLQSSGTEIARFSVVAVATNPTEAKAV